MVWRTTLVTMSTSFLLGTTFSHWIADHNVLWKTPITKEAINQSIEYYSLLDSAPVGMGWAYIVVGSVLLLSIGGRSVKGYRGKVLIASIIYYQATETYPAITLIPNPLPANLVDHPLYPALTTAVRDLATTNIITAVMLTGLIFLQAGRYYSQRPNAPPVHKVNSTVSTSGTGSFPST
ncbi:uncharacterized protein L203_105599 [Cryptococcus depauperatus CBS 7841]|uniref:Uncharacterized protein n=1 Tax=Cryptococcus depauperatus CBS 7841 TaxID=1295531 RepID=A0AAJ8JXP0_9TREE